MFYDYLAVGLIAIGLGDLILGVVTDSDTSTDPEPDLTPDEGDMLTPDPGDSNPDDYVYVSGETVVTVETGEQLETSSFQDVDFGLAPTVSGTAERDIITADYETGMPLTLEGDDGDDVISFGFGADVAGGAGSDVLNLSVTRNALASESDAGVIDLTDSNDALAVTFEDTTPAFVHIIRGQSTAQVEGVTLQTDWVDYYVSDQADLNTADIANGLYDGADATRVFRAVIGEGTADAPAMINEDATINVNREIASIFDLTQP